MEYQRKKRRLNSDINVVPYIDVMLVLLIIFMATAPLVVQGVKVDLPQANAKPIANTEDSSIPLIASVKADGTYYLTVGDNPEEELSQQALTDLVRAHLILKPETAVMIKGARSVDYDHVLQLMVSLNNAGATSVGLMTDPVEGN